MKKVSTAAAVIAPVITLGLGLMVGALPAATAAVATINDVRTGVFSLTKEAADRSTPTGRQHGDNVDTLIRRSVDPALQDLYDCLTLEAANGLPGNSICPDTTP